MSSSCFLIAARIVLSSGVRFSGCSSDARSPHFCSNSFKVRTGPCSAAYAAKRAFTPSQLYSAGRPRLDLPSRAVAPPPPPHNTAVTSSLNGSIQSRCQHQILSRRISRHGLSGRDCRQLKSSGSMFHGISTSPPMRTVPATCSPANAFALCHCAVPMSGVYVGSCFPTRHRILIRRSAIALQMSSWCDPRPCRLLRRVQARQTTVPKPKRMPSNLPPAPPPTQLLGAGQRLGGGVRRDGWPPGPAPRQSIPDLGQTAQAIELRTLEALVRCDLRFGRTDDLPTAFQESIHDGPSTGHAAPTYEIGSRIAKPTARHAVRNRTHRPPGFCRSTKPSCRNSSKKRDVRRLGGAQSLTPRQSEAAGPWWL